MSSLEERRAERRRRRQMEEEQGEPKSADELHAQVQERLERRRREREERLAAMASSVATVNGEDDLERRRRERREARLRESTDTDYTPDDYSSRRTRRRGTDEDITEDTSSYSSYRARRRRNWDDEDTPVVNETQVNDTSSSVRDTSEEDLEAERQRQREQEAEDEARRQREAEEEAEQQRQQAEEEERRERQAQLRAEEARREAEEEAERLRQEEEERERKRVSEQEVECSDSSTADDEDNGNQGNQLFIEEPDVSAKDSAEVGYYSAKDSAIADKESESDKLERVRRWTEDANSARESNSDRKWSKSSVDRSTSGDRSTTSRDRIAKFSVVNSDIKETVPDKDKSANVKEVNNNKIKDKLSKFEHLKAEPDVDAGKSKEKSLLIPVEKDGLKGKLKMFEQEIQEQSVAKKEQGVLHTPKGKKEVPAPQSQKLSAKLQHFETAAKSQATSQSSTRNVQTELEKIGSRRDQRQALLGRWSASETHINKPDNTKTETPKRNVLDRWKSVDKPTQDPEAGKTPERKEQLKKRLSGNTEFIAHRFLEKTKSTDTEAGPLSPKSPEPLRSPIGLSASLPRGSKLPSDADFGQSPVRSSYNAGFIKVDKTIDKTDQKSDVKLDSRPPRSKVTDRWSFKEKDSGASSTPKPAGQTSKMTNGNIAHSRESSSDKTASVHSRGSSYDVSSEEPRPNSQHSQEEEAEARRQREEERSRKMAEDESRKKRGKRKGLGGLTPEKKKKLKDFASDVRYTTEEEAEKILELEDRLDPLPDDLDLMTPDELRKLIKNLHEKLAQLHSESYDAEFKLHKQEKEIVDLNMKISDSKGKFAKPVLRKVNKTEQKFEAITKNKENPSSDFRETLKSTHDEEEN